MEHTTHDTGTAVAPIAIVSYSSWQSSIFNGARVTMTGTPFMDEDELTITAALIADAQRQPNGELDLLIVCFAGDDAAAKEQVIREQLCAAASAFASAGGDNTAPAFDVARWLADFTQQGGWCSAMADGRVGLGFGRCHCTDEQMAEARRMVGALSAGERDAVEAEVRVRAGYQQMGRA